VASWRNFDIFQSGTAVRLRSFAITSRRVPSRAKTTEFSLSTDGR
jgi:hypothetical protein